jgi:hypothetical protein
MHSNCMRAGKISYRGPILGHSLQPVVPVNYSLNAGHMRLAVDPCLHGSPQGGSKLNGRMSGFPGDPWAEILNTACYRFLTLFSPLL